MSHLILPHGVKPSDAIRYVPHRILLAERGGKGRMRYINLAVNADLSVNERFILLFCAAQSEIGELRMQGITVQTRGVYNCENAAHPTPLHFSMEEMPTEILDDYDLLEVPRNTYWPEKAK